MLLLRSRPWRRGPAVTLGLHPRQYADHRTPRDAQSWAIARSDARLTPLHDLMTHRFIHRSALPFHAPAPTPAPPPASA